MVSGSRFKIQGSRFKIQVDGYARGRRLLFLLSPFKVRGKKAEKSAKETNMSK